MGLSSPREKDSEESLLPPTEKKDEDLLDVVKGDGPWQWKANFLLVLFAIPATMQNLSITFFAPNVDYWCARPPGSNWTVKEWKHVGLPADDRRCSRYREPLWKPGLNLNDSSHRDVIACDAWEFDHSEYVSTIMEEWNLVCNHEWYVSLTKSVFTFGFMCSVFTFGQLSDRYGRKPIIAICNLIGVLASILSGFSSSFFMFAIWRFFLAVGVIASETVSYVLRMEIVGPEYRSFYGTVGAYAGVFGHMLLLLLAWWIRDWFWIQLALTVPSVLMLFSWWSFSESPRWLLVNGKVEKAKEVLMKIGKSNRVNMDAEKSRLEDVLRRAKKAQEADQGKASVLQLIREPRLRKQTFILFYIWFVVAFVYWGITYNTNDLAGDPFLNFAAYGLIEIPALVLTLVFIKFMGRRKPLAASYLLGGLSCLLIYFVPKDSWWLSTSTLLAGKFFIGAAFTIVYIFTVELLPTVLRNSGLGSASTVARVGNILAPFVRELGTATHPIVPQLLYGVLSVSAGLLVLLLPETNNSNMPDTVEEASDKSRYKYSILKEED